MGCLNLLLPILIILPLVIILVLVGVITISFEKLGISPTGAILLLLATLAGSLINIPVSRRRITEEPSLAFRQYFFYLPPRVNEQVVAINVGGALIPTGFAIYLFPRAELVPTIIGVAACATVARIFARPVPGVGILMPAWIPPLLAAGLAFLLARSNPAPVAYISGALGTLIGADLLNWPSYRKLGAHVISIGGAGVFDGIFLSGIVAALLA